MRSVLLASPLILAVSAFAFDCSGLRSVKLLDTTITSAAATSGNLHTPYDKDVSGLPAFCRVTGVIRPSRDSDIRFEVWMPEENWNGRYLGVGNGGFAGTIDYNALAGNLKNGFATAATDTGHQAEGADGSWAYKHPEELIDFGWRGLHLTTQNAKQVIASYYGSAAKHSYFDACSDGGREALMEAQRFPEDFDGILAGAPANYWTALVSAGSTLFSKLQDPAAYISDLKLPAISNAVVQACGSQSGTKDGFVNDPPQCTFNPDVLLCKSGDELTCLTQPQIALLKSIYAGVVDREGRQQFPGHPPGSELGPGGWGLWILGGAPGSGLGLDFYRNYFRYVVFQDPAWNTTSGQFETNFKAANSTSAQALNAINPDLHAFQAHGGKLILYHGWADPAIPAGNTINYYESVRKTLGAAMTESFVRLYMVPGMQHCVGGPSPTVFGQLGLPASGEGARYALEHWVENGTAPGDLIATQYVDDHFGDKIQRTRPLCVYPKIAKYNGSGNPDEAKSFNCVSP